jgi:hypothetical protein
LFYKLVNRTINKMLDYDKLIQVDKKRALSQQKGKPRKTHYQEHMLNYPAVPYFKYSKKSFWQISGKSKKKSHKIILYSSIMSVEHIGVEPMTF